MVSVKISVLKTGPTAKVKNRAFRRIIRAIVTKADFYLMITSTILPTFFPLVGLYSKFG